MASGRRSNHTKGAVPHRAEYSSIDWGFHLAYPELQLAGEQQGGISYDILIWKPTSLTDEFTITAGTMRLASMRTEQIVM
jgi:hypothetical protein